jgi:hypothetical protein
MNSRGRHKSRESIVHVKQDIAFVRWSAFEHKLNTLLKYVRKKRCAVYEKQLACNRRQTPLDGNPAKGGTAQNDPRITRIQTKKEKNMFTKKIFIALFIAAMTTITAFGQKGAAPSWTSPAGAWVGTVTSGPGGPPPFRVLMNFTADGNFIGSGDGDSFSGASPGHGVWERIGGTSSRTYAVTFLQLFYAPDSSPTFLSKVRQTVILNSSGNTWEGPATVEFFTPDGTTLLFAGTATGRATRIQSEPLP